MFGWFKKNDGFEWKEYVRTTILLKRKKRKDKLKQAQAAAVDGLKAAGKAGVSAGASGASTVGPVLGDALAAMLRAPFWLMSRLAGGVGRVLGGLRMLLAKGLGPLLETISPPNLRGPLAVIGAIALLAVVARYPANGIDPQSQLAGGIGLAAVVLAGLPWLLSGKRPPLPAWLLDPVKRVFGSLPAMSRFGGGLAAIGPGAMGVITLVAVIAGGPWLYSRWSGQPGTGASGSSILSGLPLVAAKPVEGRATGLSGDTLKVGASIIRLSGLDVPERDQKCRRQGGKAWACGQSAAEALAQLVRGRDAVCDISGKDDAGRQLGTCKVDGKDVGAEMVRAGHAFAVPGLFARYSAAETEAKTAKAGVWKGDGERPGEWRAKRWEQAKRSAPDGCPIKGHVSSEGRVYVLPWSPEYERVKVRTNKGERWFCTEQEARAAGWRALERG